MAYSNLGYTDHARNVKMQKDIRSVTENIDSTVAEKVEPIKIEVNQYTDQKVLKSRTFQTVKEFGVESGGTKNQLAKIQAAIDEKSASGGGVLTFPDDGVYNISGILYTKPNVTIQGGELKWIGSAQIVVRGDNPGIKHMKLNAGAYGPVLTNSGLIEIVEGYDYVIEDVDINGTSASKGIMCKTRQRNGRMSDVRIKGVAWGILFNDAVSEQTAAYRTVDNVNYADAAIGDGLIVERFFFSAGTGRTGDGIELNCPDYGMSNIRVTDSLVSNTNWNGNSGIAYGFAKCWDVIGYGNKAYNCGHDAVHFEKGGHHKWTEFYAFNCERGYSVSHTENTVLDNCTFRLCGTWGVSYSDVTNNGPHPKMYDFTLSNSKFYGTKADPREAAYGIIVGNAANVRITGNTFREYAGQATGAIVLLKNTNLGNVTDSDISNNIFDKGASTVTPQKCVTIQGDDATNNIVSNNKVIGYSGDPFSVDIRRNSLHYFVRRNVEVVAGTPQSLYRTGATIESPLPPQGYAVGREGTEFVDTKSRKRYLGNGPHSGATNQQWVEQPITTATPAT